jgi:hypothetical protein
MQRIPINDDFPAADTEKTTEIDDSSTKRPTLTSFHPTPPGSPSLLQVSINSEEVQPDYSSGNWRGAGIKLSIVSQKRRPRVERPKRVVSIGPGCIFLVAVGIILKLFAAVGTSSH